MTRFPRARVPTPAPAAAASAAAVLATLLGGCGGGGTKTVSAASSPPVPQTASTATPPPATTTGAATTPSHTTPTGATSAAGTRTAPAPAFAEKERGGAAGGSGATEGEGLSAALAVVHTHGYTVANAADYHPSQTLRVLIGTGAKSNDGYDKQAFFFVDGRFIGTDSSQPSAMVSVASQSDTEITLAYSLYRSSDPLCCPGGGQAKVRFQLNNGHLQPLDPIPPVNSSTGLSRQ